MADPVIVNRRPDEGDTDVSADTPFRFGVRDVDTRIDLTSVYAAAVYGKAIYEPDEDIPSNDDALKAEATAYFSTFDDASGTAEPGNPCDQTIEDVSGTDVYRIEKSDADGVPQEGVLFIHVDDEGVRPYAASAKIDLAFVDTGSSAYLPWSDAVGPLMGLVYWAENTGVFLFFRDDGTKKVSIVGPAEDGSGTRSVETTTVFDWSAEAYTYTIVIDPSVYRRKVMVFATDSAGEETLLAELDLDTFNEFLASVRMGNLYAEDAPSKVTAVLGIDPRDMGNYIDIYDFVLHGYGAVLVQAGGQTGSSEVVVTPLEALHTPGEDGFDDWRSVGTMEVEATDNSSILTAEAGSAYLRRDETDLESGEWLVLGKLAGANASHAGFYTTGMALIVEDGTRAFKLHFLDNFAANFIGIEEADADEHDDVSGYKIPSDGPDWETAFSFQLLGSASRDRLLLTVDGAETIDHTYSASGYPSSTTAGVSFGFTETGDFSGDFYLFYLWLFPNCVFYEGEEATYPEAQGWTRTTSGATRSLADEDLEIDATGVGHYDIYSVTDSTYDETSGAAVIFSAALESWTDDAGASSPPRSEFGPIAAVRTTTVAAQVFFVKNLDGVVYVYLSHEASDVSDVLAQNEAGRAISAEIDLDEEHIFILDVKPFHYIRLYLNMETTPAIEVKWEDSGTGLRALPTNMPADAVVAVGSLGEDAGVKGTFSYFRSSIGRGYDFSASLSLTEDALQEHVYGSKADIVIDVQDED